MKIYLNGKMVTSEEAKIEYNDRGFLLADGLFETMRVYQGKTFCLKEHYDRLQRSAKYLDIVIPITFLELEKIAEELLKQNGLDDKDASMRLTVTRGTGPRGLLPPDDPKPTLMLAAFPLASHAPTPVSIHVTSIVRNEFSPLSNIKSLCYLDNILARREAKKHHADDGILLNTKGYVAETSYANIFIVTKDDTIITPRLEDGALPGITRQVVIELANELKLPLKEGAIRAEDLYSAKEIFTTNSLMEIQFVNKVNEKSIAEEKIGEITLKLQSAYKEKVKKNLFNQETPSACSRGIAHSVLFKGLSPFTETTGDKSEVKVTSGEERKLTS